MGSSRHAPALVGAGVLGLVGLVVTPTVLPVTTAPPAAVVLSLGVGVLCAGVVLAMWWVLDTAFAAQGRPAPPRSDELPVVLLRRLCTAAVEVRVRAVGHAEVEDLMRLTTELVESVFAVTRLALASTGDRLTADLHLLRRSAESMEFVARTLDDQAHTVSIAGAELTDRLGDLHRRLAGEPDGPTDKLERDTR